MDVHPYKSQPARSFWRTAVAEADLARVDRLWAPKFALGQDDPVLTAGSCFARHLGPALRDEGMNWDEAELPPPGLTETERQARHYGRFSFRTGNIYTAAALLQWLSWAFDETAPPEEVWTDDDRYRDPFRPTVEPGGYPSADAMTEARRTTLAAIRTALTGASCLIFTLGLTETWRNRSTGAAYPVCPGTTHGTFDAGHHVFHNASFADVYRDLAAAIALARRANPQLKVLLTVSPVPLTATATTDHALTATTYSKSVLRAVAGQLAQELDHVDYFPSYELVTGFPFGGAAFQPNLRTVTPEGVAFVMRHFFAAVQAHHAPDVHSSTPRPAHSDTTAPGTPGHPGEEFWCEDAVLDYYSHNGTDDSHNGTDRGTLPPAR